MDYAATPVRAGRVLATICVGHFISHFWAITLPPLFVVLAAEFGVNFLQLGLVMTTFSVTNALFQMPFGFLADRYGPKPVLTAGLLLSGTAFSLYTVAPSYAVLLGLAVMAGMGQAVFHPADYAILSALFPKERAGRAYSFHTFSGFAGSAAAPLVIATLNHAFNWQVALAFAGALGLSLGLYVLFRLHVPLTAMPAQTTESKSRRREKSGVRIRAVLPTTLLTLFAFFLFTSMFSSGLNSFLPSALTERYDIAASTANTVLTVYLATLAGGVLLGGILADRIRNYTLVISVAFTTGMLLMFLVAAVRPPFWLLLPIFAVAGGLQGVIMPSRDKMVREAAPEGAAAKSFAFVSVGMNLGGLVGLPLLGTLLDRGDPDLVFWALATFMLLATFTVVVPVRTVRSRALARAGERVST